jgi:hypothetical protein
MPFLLLLLLMLACLPVRWPGPPQGIGLAGAVLLTWSCVALVVLAGAFLAQATRRDAYRGIEFREVILGRHANGRFYHLIGLFVVYGLVLYVLGWGWVVQTVFAMTPTEPGMIRLVPGAELLILAPFLVALILSWVCFYDGERALHETSLRH